MVDADFFHTKCLGLRLWSAIYAVIALMRSFTLVKVPRRMRLPVISAKNRSTMFNHDALVGVKWKWNR